MSQHWLEPNWSPGVSVPNLPHQHFLERGIKAIVLDVDRTILPGREIIIPKPVIEWVKESKRSLEVHLLSNNPSRKRVGSVAEQLGINFTCRAAKPRRRALQNVLLKLKLNPLSIAMVGDRLFTDVLVGNRLGLYTVLVSPIDSEGNSSINDKVQRFEQLIADLLGAKKK